MNINAPLKGISLRNQIIVIAIQEVITADPRIVTMIPVVFCQIIDPIKYTINVREPDLLIKKICSSLLRDHVGNMTYESLKGNKNQLQNTLQVSVNLNCTKSITTFTNLCN